MPTPEHTSASSALHANYGESCAMRLAALLRTRTMEVVSHCHTTLWGVGEVFGLALGIGTSTLLGACGQSPITTGGCSSLTCGTGTTVWLQSQAAQVRRCQPYTRL